MLSFPVEKPYDFEVVQAMWTLGRIPPGLLPDVAAEAMVAGHDGRAVLALASYHPPLLDGINQAMEAALREMGRPPMTRSRAAWLVARYLAKLVVAGKLDSCEWCFVMGDYSWDERNTPEGDDLAKLHGLSLMYEENLGSPVKTRREMLEEARGFAMRPEPRQSK